MYARLESLPLHHWYPTHYITGTQRVPKFTPTVPKFTPRVPNLWDLNFGTQIYALSTQIYIGLLFRSYFLFGTPND